MQCKKSKEELCNLCLSQPWSRKLNILGWKVSVLLRHKHKVHKMFWRSSTLLGISNSKKHKSFMRLNSKRKCAFYFNSRISNNSFFCSRKSDGKSPWNNNFPDIVQKFWYSGIRVLANVQILGKNSTRTAPFLGGTRLQDIYI